MQKVYALKIMWIPLKIDKKETIIISVFPY